MGGVSWHSSVSAYLFITRLVLKEIFSFISWPKALIDDTQRLFQFLEFIFLNLEIGLCSKYYLAKMGIFALKEFETRYLPLECEAFVYVTLAKKCHCL